MLAEDVGRRAHLEVVDEVIVGNQVGVPVLDNVAGVATEEEWLRRAAGAAGRVGECRFDVVPQRQHALLREVPAVLVERDVELNGRGFITTYPLLIGDGINVDGFAVVVYSRIRERRAELR